MKTLGAVALLLPGLALSMLVLPPPGTDSRERRFCRAWLELSTAERQQVLIDADGREAESDVERACRERARPALRRKIDAECANWTKLMDFEVRAIVDAAWERCHTAPNEPRSN